ncbi:hypothetical protein GT037_005946 [Alternaria burnsii]|uniref:Uncharacterized protein n=1 Tax=Alternaria burnsii TaxID=1187904 RepID=A0A8H7B799_9PLEO|nr:uncharacterized protein GT037_005946 [Alternaria burnsii]KAF7676441.1 hypothetical protein GT037_005946 [Alternaria burnsii]
MAATPWSETMLFYRCAWPRRTDGGNIIVNVELMPHARDAGCREKLWAAQLIQAHACEQRRRAWAPRNASSALTFF